MSNSKKILIGILSVLPLILFIIYFVTMISFFLHMFREIGVNGQEAEQVIWTGTGNMIGMIISVGLLGIISLAVMVYFIVHAINNQGITRDERIVWILVFIFVGMVTFPVYWYMRIWKAPAALTNV